MTSCSKKIPLVDASSTRPMTPIPPRGKTLPRSLRQQEHDLGKARLSGFTPEPDLFNILILNYTMKCPLACDYCCYHCSPKRMETMDLALALDLVDQAAELGVFQQCGFTGGEALIFYDDVMKLTARMQKHGMPYSMISSCYWATTPAEARRVLKDLKGHGIDVFSATHDPSHANWVPLQYIRNAVDAALELDVHVCLCSSFYDDQLRLENIFPEYCGNINIDIVNRVVLPDAGRSSRLDITPKSYSNVDPVIGMGACYKRIYHDVTVFWDGEIYPCCSVYNRDTPALSLGNAYKDSLATIWDRVQGSLLLRTIKHEGFAELFGLISKHDPELAKSLPDPKTAIGACHLCHLVFRDPQIAGRVYSLMERYEQNTIKRLLAQVSTQEGEHAARRVIEEALLSAQM